MDKLSYQFTKSINLIQNLNLKTHLSQSLNHSMSFFLTKVEMKRNGLINESELDNAIKTE